VERQLPHIIPEQQQPETGNDEQERCFQPSRCRFLKADIPEKDGYRSNRNKNNPERPDLCTASRVLSPPPIRFPDRESSPPQRARHDAMTNRQWTLPTLIATQDQLISSQMSQSAGGPL